MRPSELRKTEQGLVPHGDGWFVLNAGDAPWLHAPGRSAFCIFEGEPGFDQVGINLSVLGPGQPMAMYHREADQEDFLVLAGEPVVVIEDTELALRPWDLVHCPAGTAHVIVGAGQTPCLVVALGARTRSTGPAWGEYVPSESARRHGASVAERTTDPDVAYAGLTRRRPTAADPDWLP